MSPRPGQPHDHAYDTETLDEKADRIRAEQGLPPYSQHSGPLPCHWYEDGQGGRWLIPGCMARVNDPDIDECSCKTVEEQLAAARAELARLQRHHDGLQSWNAAIRAAVYAHPDGIEIMRAAVNNTQETQR
jgi:hypothetical protein